MVNIMREYEQRLMDAINEPQQHVAPHLRLVHKADLLAVLKRVQRLEKALYDSKLRLLANKKAPR